MTPLSGMLARLLTGRAFLPICFFAYLLPRLAILLVQPLQQTSDFAWYYHRAVEIAAGSGYAQGGVPTAFWPVGWPGFLGVIYSFTGPSPLVGQIANLGLSVLVFGFTAALGTACFGDRRVGRAAVLLLALYPNQIAYVPLLSAEILFAVLLLMGVTLLAREQPGIAVLAGLVFGVAALTKAQALFIPLALVLGVWLVAPSWAALARLGRIAVVASLAMVLVVAPWTWRNYRVFETFIPVSTNGGWTLLTGNNPQANGDYAPDNVLAQGLSHEPADEVATDRTARDRAFAWIADNPVAFLELVPLKAFRLWAPDGEAEWFYQRGMATYEQYKLVFRAVRMLNQAYYAALLLLALPSLLRLVRYRRDLPAWATAPASLSLYFTLISVIFSGQSRFHFALMPFIALYAGWTLARLAGAATATEREALAKSVFAPPTDAPAEYGPGGLPCKNAR